MRVWMIHMGENVQSDGGDARLYRLGALAEVLEARGHDVERWVPTFNHNTLSQRFDRDTDVRVTDRHVITHIHAAGFSRHRSVARLRFHRAVASRWVELGRRAEHRPDLILTSIPTPEIAAAGIELGRQHKAHVVVDVRDLWPDVYASMVPRAVRPLARVALGPARARISRTVRSASSLVAVSRAYLEWALELAGRSEGPLDRVFPLSYRPPTVDEAGVAAAVESWTDRVGGARLVYLFLGTFTKFFALEDVVGAARILESRRPGQVAWVLAGHGPTLGAVTEAARDVKTVVLPGWLGATDAMALLRIADVGLAPYTADALQSLPNKPFEYAWAGLPILSSLRGELEEIIDSQGLGRNFRCGDREGLASLVESMLDDPSLKDRWAGAIRRYWESELIPEKVYGEFAGHLEYVAASGSRLEGPA